MALISTTYMYNDITDNMTDTPNDGKLVELDWLYWTMHVIALLGLFVSIICSVTVIIWQQRTASNKAVFKRKLGERLVVYLAITDLLFSISHSCDHWLIIVANGYRPPVIPCIVFAVTLLGTIFAQNLLVFVTALSLCVLVTCNKKVSFGPYDVGLLFISYVLPGVVIIYAVAKDYMGFHVFWCFMNIFNPAAIELLVIHGFFQTIVFFIIVGLYSIVWLKIIQSARRLRHFDKDDPNKKSAKGASDSNMKTAKILTLFGLAYFAQWWPAITAGIWTFFKPVNVYFLINYVIFHNTGGVFNMIAYTYVRKWSSGDKKPPGVSTGTSSDGATSLTTVSSTVQS